MCKCMPIKGEVPLYILDRLLQFLSTRDSPAGWAATLLLGCRPQDKLVGTQTLKKAFEIVDSPASSYGFLGFRAYYVHSF
jgi:hypothetical protein